MAFYSDETLEAVQRGNDIVEVASLYTKLRQQGGSFRGLCPIHRDKNNPAFSVSPDTQMFHCFSCNAGGNVFKFIMQVENLGFVDAVVHLAKRARIELPEERKEDSGLKKLREVIYDANAKAARFYYDCLVQSTGEQARTYLLQRRIKNSTLKKFGLGYAPDEWSVLYKYLKGLGFSDETLDRGGLVSKNKNGYIDKFRNRLMFPIFDAMNRVCGFGGRSFDDNGPKYLNSPETPVFSKNRNLFALNLARKIKANEVIVVEGYMDVLALNQAGFECTVATLGTATGKEHARALNQFFRGKTAILLFDSDRAGESAALRAIPILQRENTPTKLLRLQGAKDPDEFLINFGAEAFADALRLAMPPVEYQLKLLKEKSVGNEDGVRSYINDAAAVIAELDPVERDLHIINIAKETGVSVDAIRGKLENMDTTVLPMVNTEAFFTTPKIKTDINEGIMKAYRNILYITATHNVFYKAIIDTVKPEEILYDAFRTLYSDICFRRNRNNAPVNPKDLNSEDKDNQDSVSVIFTNPMVYTNDEALRLALNHEIYFIKKAYIEHQITAAKSENDEKTLNLLGLARRNLPISYI